MAAMTSSASDRVIWRGSWWQIKRLPPGFSRFLIFSSSTLLSFLKKGTLNAIIRSKCLAGKSMLRKSPWIKSILSSNFFLWQFLRAEEIITEDRSIAVTLPVVKDAASKPERTPVPQPISRILKFGAEAKISAAIINRSGTFTLFTFQQVNSIKGIGFGSF